MMMASEQQCRVCHEPRTPGLPCGRCLLEREPPVAVIHGGEIELHEEIGSGAMGTVFRAYHVRLGREVAVKLATPGVHESSRRIRREVEAMAQLAHPNILSLLDRGDEDGQAFLVMPYAPGGTLATRAPLDIPAVIALGRTLADALEHAHRRGVIHCDIKPENVLIDGDDRPLLADFGIAHRPADPRTTAHNRGTPYFVAPEVLEGTSPDARSDIFSLGALLHFMRHGKLPPVGSAPVIEHPIDREIARAMEREPARRHASAGALRDALSGLGQRARTPATRWPAVALVGALAVIGVVGAVVLREERTPPSPQLVGLWHMRAEPIDGRGAGKWVVKVERDGEELVMDYGNGVMRCELVGARCTGTWRGRTGDGWYHVDVATDGHTFAGFWGYRGETRSAPMIGTRIQSR